MRLSTKLVVVTLGLVIIPLVLLTASLFLLRVYRPRSLRLGYGQEDTNIMNINVIRRFDSLMSQLDQQMLDTPAEKLLDPAVLSLMNESFRKDGAYLLGYTETCYFNGDSSDSNEDVLYYIADPDAFADRDKLYFAGLSHPYLIGCRRFAAASGPASLYLVCDVSGSLPSVTRLIFLIGISVLALVGGSIVMLGWLRLKFARPMKELQEAARSIAEGNLDYELVPESDDEFGELMGTFEEMRRRLKSSAEEQLRYEQDSKLLLGNISHDLKTPITAIKGYVEGIRDGVASSPEKQAKYLATIYNKADDMDKLVDQLAFYSLVDTNRMPYHFVKIPVRAYFDDCRDELTTELEAQEFDLIYDNSVPEETKMIGDPEQLHRVISNIVSNSVKYRSRNRRGQIGLRIRQEEERLLIELSDNGIGIEKKDLEHIFDRFYRSDTSRSAATGGNGIGLSIVKKIVEDHGGRIWAESRPGEGTKLTMELRTYEEKNHEQNTDR